MNSEKILDALNNIDDNLIAETSRIRDNNSRKRKIIKYVTGFASAAAGICLVFMLVSVISRNNDFLSNGPATTSDAISATESDKYDNEGNVNENRPSLDEAPAPSESVDKYEDIVNSSPTDSGIFNESEVTSGITSTTIGDINDAPQTSPGSEKECVYVTISEFDSINKTIKGVTAVSDNDNYGIPEGFEIIVNYDDNTKLFCENNNFTENKQIIVQVDPYEIYCKKHDSGKEYFIIRALSIFE